MLLFSPAELGAAAFFPAGRNWPEELPRLAAVQTRQQLRPGTPG